MLLVAASASVAEAQVSEGLDLREGPPLVLIIGGPAGPSTGALRSLSAALRAKSRSHRVVGDATATRALRQVPSLEIHQLAEAVGADLVVRFDVNDADLLMRMYDNEGRLRGRPVRYTGAASLQPAQIEIVAGRLQRKLNTLPAATSDSLAAEAENFDPDAPEPGSRSSFTWPEPDPMLWRGQLALEFAVRARVFEFKGPLTPSWVQSAAMPALGASLAVAPLHFAPTLVPARWSGWTVEARYHAAFFNQPGASGSPCTGTFDHLALQTAWVAPVLSDPNSPSVGLGLAAAFTRAQFRCSDPVVNTGWKALHPQLRVVQPLLSPRYRLEAIVGPRIIWVGPGDAADLGFAAELWFTARPISILFLRAGVTLDTTHFTRGASELRDMPIVPALQAGAFL